MVRNFNAIHKTSTTKGRVVYERPIHRMDIGDATRILRSTLSMPLLSYAQPEKQLLALGTLMFLIIDYIIREAFFFRFRGLILGLVKQILQRLWDFVMDRGFVKDTKNSGVVSGVISSIV